ncbi:MAG: cytochrome b/b6 domain-containing protein [Stenotrophomonas nitritireducens]|uniref:Cytochrome b/b6 domain-containing protein n=1 Tax=Stenotrophomonas nitritireducens TaxID=83617 RepID=A0A9D8KWR8_9GAMM|nr:cytochrome b/b6 domain-containing protein [Stenotrophomonas nitritireducens]
MLTDIALCVRLGEGRYSTGSPLPWFGLFQLPALAARDPDLRQVLDTAHVWLFWTLAALVALHLAAVLHHQLLRRDGLLRRMLPAGRG